MKVLQTFGISKTPSQTTATVSAPSQRISIFDATNRSFVRLVVLTNDGIRLTRGATSAGIAMADLFSALATLESGLTWSPLVGTQPTSNHLVYAGVSTGFGVVATSEIDFTYQWQISSDSGVTYSNLSNAGVYTGVTTNTLVISSGASLGGKYYRCVVTNAAGSTNSTGGSLTVVPLITSSSVAAPAAATFDITPVGPGTITYQWQRSDDAGSTWGNQANTGVYTGATTAVLHISDSTGLNGKKYRCQVTGGSTTVTTGVGTLTVT